MSTKFKNDRPMDNVWALTEDRIEDFLDCSKYDNPTITFILTEGDDEVVMKMKSHPLRSLIHELKKRRTREAALGCLLKDIIPK